MKSFVSFLALALGFALAGCSGPKVTLPAVPVDAVEIYMPGAAPDEEYKVLSRISEEAALNAEDQVLINQAQVKAAKLGADALIITEIRATTEGGVSTDLSLERKKLLEALAVYFPSRHPDLIAN